MYSSKSQTEAFIRLAAAIVNSGYASNDQSFLESDWCKYLTDTVIEYNNISDAKRLGLFSNGCKNIALPQSGD